MTTARSNGDAHSVQLRYRMCTPTSWLPRVMRRPVISSDSCTGSRPSSGTKPGLFSNQRSNSLATSARSWSHHDDHGTPCCGKTSRCVRGQGQTATSLDTGNHRSDSSCCAWILAHPEPDTVDNVDNGFRSRAVRPAGRYRRSGRHRGYPDGAG